VQGTTLRVRARARSSRLSWPVLPHLPGPLQLGLHRLQALNIEMIQRGRVAGMFSDAELSCAGKFCKSKASRSAELIKCADQIVYDRHVVNRRRRTRAYG